MRRPKAKLWGGAGGGSLTMSAKMAAALTPRYVLQSQPCPPHHLTARNRGRPAPGAAPPRPGPGAEPELRTPGPPSPDPRFLAEVPSRLGYLAT